MKVQAQEELSHADKYFHYLVERGGRVLLTAIDGPPTEWKDVEVILKNVLEHEQHVTALINGLMDLAIAENDHPSVMFLQWFVNEQVEEEAAAQNILGKLKIAGTSSPALYMLDKEMAQRVFAPSASE
jgi:ferritin